MKLLRVNLASGTSLEEELAEELQPWGNRGLCAHIVGSEVPPHCEALGPHNKLVFATGSLAGLGVSSADRLSLGAKSPLTGGIKEANSGGTAARALARLGYRALVVEEQAPAGSPMLLLLSREGAELRPAAHLWGLGNYALAEALRREFGPDISTIAIGPAGERLYHSSGVFISDIHGSPERTSARGGLGAVMGSKGLKAMIVRHDGDAKPTLADPRGFAAARKAFTNALLRTPQTAEAYPKYGTAGVLKVINMVGGLPTRNFTSGEFEAAEAICGERLYDVITERGGEGTPTKPCMHGCVIRCSNIFPNRAGKHLVAPLEYETLALLGSNLGLDSFDDIALLNRLCNDLGVDTIETGAALGVAAAAGLFRFGDAAAIRSLVEEMGRSSATGRVLGQGAVVTGKVLGVSRIPAAKGQGLPAHEPRAIKSMGVTYSMSPMGADHTTAVTIRAKVDHHSPQGQLDLSRNTQITVAAVESLGFCTFVLPAVVGELSLITDMTRAACGAPATPEDLRDMGRAVLRRERAFNLAAGLGPASERLPEFFRVEPLPPFGLVFDVPEEELATFWDGV